MKKILVPTDFSKPAQFASMLAADIAKKSIGEVILLHIIERPFSDSFNIEGQVLASNNWEEKLYTMKLIEQARDKMANAAEGILSEGVSVRQELRLGNPFHGMRSMITEHDVDLVVMGTSGHSKLEEMIVGSNTEKVVRFAHCPVLTVHNKVTHLDFKNIVYATALDQEQSDFSEIVRNAQQIYGATVHLLRVNTPTNFQPDTKVKEIMKDFALSHKLTNYTINVFNDFTEEEGIIHFANSIRADLIAMSTHGRTGFAHVLAGSIAEDVVNHSSLPVLTYVVK